MLFSSPFLWLGNTGSGQGSPWPEVSQLQVTKLRLKHRQSVCRAYSQTCCPVFVQSKESPLAEKSRDLTGASTPWMRASWRGLAAGQPPSLSPVVWLYLEWCCFSFAPSQLGPGRPLPTFPTSECTSDVEPDTREMVRAQNKKKKKSGGFQFHVQELRENRPMHCSQMKINRFSPVEAFPVFQSDFENKRHYRRSKVTPLLGKITGIWNKCRRGKCKTYLLFSSLFSFCTFLFHSHSQTH